MESFNLDTLKNAIDAIDDTENKPNIITHADISNTDINKLHETNPLKKWIKCINTDSTILINEYTRNDLFSRVASITLDTEVYASGPKIQTKKRNTLIKFNPIIKTAEFNQNAEWIYIITINNRIVKLGGTRTGLKQRAASYLCGHHTTERGKSGDCSKTNGYVYNTLLFYLTLGCEVSLYGYKLPVVHSSIDIFNNTVPILVQTYHKYESIYLNDFLTTYKSYPPLNDNCDPEFKKSTSP